MNGSRKWHKANGPAFAPGEKWVAVDGSCGCTIVSVCKYSIHTGRSKWDYEVTYQFDDGRTSSNDVWNFQVRYQHIADQHI